MLLNLLELVVEELEGVEEFMGFELEIEEEIERVALDVDDLVSVVRASAVVLCILKEEL